LKGWIFQLTMIVHLLLLVLLGPVSGTCWTNCPDHHSPAPWSHGDRILCANSSDRFARLETEKGLFRRRCIFGKVFWHFLPLHPDRPAANFISLSGNCNACCFLLILPRFLSNFPILPVSHLVIELSISYHALYETIQKIFDFSVCNTNALRKHHRLLIAWFFGKIFFFAANPNFCPSLSLYCVTRGKGKNSPRYKKGTIDVYFVLRLEDVKKNWSMTK
jgi:hypothetical protein